MPTIIPTERVDFLCRGIRCAAWLTLPARPIYHPPLVASVLADQSAFLQEHLGVHA